MNKSKMEMRSLLLASGNVRPGVSLATSGSGRTGAQSLALAIAARQRELNRKVVQRAAVAA